MASRQGLESWVARHLRARPSPRPNTDTKNSHQTAPTPSEDEDVHPGEVAAVQCGEREQDAGAISMPQVLCEHGRLDPSKAGDMKLITRVSAID